MNHTLDLVPFWRIKHYTCSTGLPVRQSTRVNTPLGMFSCPLAFHVGDFCNEVSNHLCLYGSTWAVLYVDSLNSITHSAIRPATSLLLIARHRGLSVRTTIVWAWKYGLSLRVAITKVKASFSIGGYLSSTPRNAQLVQYISFHTLSFSLTKATLMAIGDTAK